ncbi:Adenosylcobinamide amidohydrolase [Candidatus Desulfarcum epimagneticum]|uniref:Adenosylcobinamide amidohydrolase n=1 Tax=uncultured Desulfobacteraceae bacterium TaxID=218296 RepID=A0A484HJK2_9BACT|nr:Adenosylcobinamide amidohydrolase [uncultured Desulfobacteraceae bacterium]
MKRFFTLLFAFLFIPALLFTAPGPLAAYPLSFSDDAGKSIVLDREPSRAVSLVPSVTEMILAIGAGESLKGITWHSVTLPGAAGKTVAGGFFDPSARVVAALRPDVVFVSDIHEKIDETAAPGARIIVMDSVSIPGAFDQIRLLGDIFNRKDRAREVVRKIEKDFDIIRKKTRAISPRKRVMRIMGRDRLMTPGADSFQNEIIRAAGGIPPENLENGDVVFMGKEAFEAFNPEILYGCGRDRDIEKNVLHLPGWRDVDAVRNKKIFYFPCELTCRASVNAAYFTGWLAASIYGDALLKKESRVFGDKIFKSRPIDTVPGWVRQARIAESRIHDFVHKTLIIDFKTPMAIVSTLEGIRRGVGSIGNHYIPPHHWPLTGAHTLEALRKTVYPIIGADAKQASFLFTGADMDHLSAVTETFKDIEVYVLATAGVSSNAMRMSVDRGDYYEPGDAAAEGRGTINLIIMADRRLTPRAMTRAVITATEAKTAALMDMDIRSSYQGGRRATGTGTDNIIVAEGAGPALDHSGGHSKLGELIARAVYKAVREAVAMQNGLFTGRHVFQRLMERGILIHELADGPGFPGAVEKRRLKKEAREILLNPSHASFMASALGVSDDYEKGLIADLSSFERWAEDAARRIAGRPCEIKPFTAGQGLPKAVSTALDAIFSGAAARLRDRGEIK